VRFHLLLRAQFRVKGGVAENISSLASGRDNDGDTLRHIRILGESTEWKDDTQADNCGKPLQHVESNHVHSEGVAIQTQMESRSGSFSNAATCGLLGCNLGDELLRPPAASGSMRCSQNVTPVRHAVYARTVADSSLASLNVRIRVMRADENAFGPGKADLLESLLETGSLNRSASGMKMSYVKAFSLVHAMNDLFREPLVELSRGGRQGGGTRVTDFGRRVLAEYRALCEAGEKAIRPSWRKLRKLLKE